MKKNLLCLALTLLLWGTACLPTLAAEKSVFQDIDPSSPFYEAVLWAVGNGITNGTSATTFSPNEQCKRKHIITFTWRGSGKPFDDSWIYPYKDDSSLTPDSDFGKAATWAFYRTVEQGSVTADGQLMFYPNWDCNRGQAVIYLWRLSGRPRDGVDLGVLNQFTDVRIDNRTDDAYTRELPYAVAWAVQNGITNGTTETTFSPQNAITRGHIVTFLYRFSKTPNGRRVLVQN